MEISIQRFFRIFDLILFVDCCWNRFSSSSSFSLSSPSQRLCDRAWNRCFQWRIRTWIVEPQFDDDDSLANHWELWWIWLNFVLILVLEGSGNLGFMWLFLVKFSFDPNWKEREEILCLWCGLNCIGSDSDKAIYSLPSVILSQWNGDIWTFGSTLVFWTLRAFLQKSKKRGLICK